jgi:hypothetical protein
MRYGTEHTFEAEQGDGDTVSDIEKLSVRLSVVEDKVAQLTDDGATTRAVAALADRDVADFKAVMRGHASVLSALRETQVEQGALLAEHSVILAEHSVILAEHSDALRTVHETLDTLVAGQTAILRHFGLPGEGGEQTSGLN